MSYDTTIPASFKLKDEIAIDAFEACETASALAAKRFQTRREMKRYVRTLFFVRFYFTLKHVPSWRAKHTSHSNMSISILLA
jgi:hypothetical protein